QRAQLGTAHLPQPPHIPKRTDIKRRHRVQTQQTKADVTQMNLIKRPVAHPRRPKRATITRPMPKNPPSVRQLVTVLRDRPRDLPIIVRMPLTKPKRPRAHPQRRINPLLSQPDSTPRQESILSRRLSQRAACPKLLRLARE